MLTDEAVADLIVQLVPPGGRMLDVGCGAGHTLATLARRGVHGTGTDPYPYGRAPCQCLLAEQISTLQQTFDLIYTLCALHEFDAPATFLAEVKHILRPDGILVIMDWVPGAKTGVRERYFAPQTVAGWLAGAGFHILRQEVRGQTMILVGRMPIPGDAT